MNVTLWIVQGLLCLLFLSAGGTKVFAFEKYKETAEKRSAGRGLGASRGLVAFIGISELAGAFGLILPMASGILPMLTPLAALGLGLIMLLATGYHLKREEPAWMTVVLLMLADFVAVGRGFN